MNPILIAILLTVELLIFNGAVFLFSRHEATRRQAGRLFSETKPGLSDWLLFIVAVLMGCAFLAYLPIFWLIALLFITFNVIKASWFFYHNVSSI